jgi:ABC transport system ATP-binding/permease protein
MWKLNVEDDQGNVTTVNLVREEYSIGREAGNSVRLTERNISRKHAVLARRSDGWVLRDGGSYNGCFVNGNRVAGEQELAHTDLIQLGDYRLELVDEAMRGADAKKATIPVRPLSQTLKELPDRLVMLAGPAVGVPFSLLESKVLVGRGEDCDLPINDTSVSRLHAEIHSMGQGRYEIVDMDSSNGVRINGVDLKRGFLEAGDVLELGDVVLKFIPAGQLFNVQEYLAAVGRRHSLEPGIGEFSNRSSSSSRLVATAAIIAVIVVIILAATRTPETPGGVATVEPPRSQAALALDEAERLLAEGDIDGAMAKAAEIPEDSNLRASRVFKDVYARWADQLFEAADEASEKNEKRSILDKIASSQNVGSVERKRAANEIALLDNDSVDVSDLPSEKPKTAPAPKSTVSPTIQRPRTNAEPEPAPRPEPAQAPAPPSPRQEVKGGLVRDTPF